MEQSANQRASRHFRRSRLVSHHANQINYKYNRIIVTASINPARAVHVCFPIDVNFLQVLVVDSLTVLKIEVTMSRLVFVSVMCLLLSAQLIDAAPKPDWLDQLFSGPSRPYYGQGRSAAAAPSNRQPRDRFKSICRVISGNDNYAFPGKVPYPSAPFCPYGD